MARARTTYELASPTAPVRDDSISTSEPKPGKTWRTTLAAAQTKPHASLTLPEVPVDSLAAGCYQARPRWRRAWSNAS